MLNRYFPVIIFLLPVILFAQPANDECFNAIPLTDLDSWCSLSAEYTNIAATESEQSLPPCFYDLVENRDVWFSFVATAPNVSVSVIGDVEVNSGGTLYAPNVAIYEGTCNNLDLLGCQSALLGIDQVALFATPLSIGETYFIRISTAPAPVGGTFQLCINNFFNIPEPSGDCEPGVVLCDKSSFTTDFVTGAGDVVDEIGDVGCNSGTCDLTESSSTWYKWVCDESGTLEFTISPLNPQDDIDFVLFELPNGIDDCSGKFDLRCMASGENVGEPIEDWIECTGPTGLSDTDLDFSESCGCQDGNNNFVDAIDMVSGTAYALVINNFSQSDNGFSIDFGGTGTFLGPKVDFTFSPTEEVCLGEEVTYVDASTFVGNITEWNWYFGEGAIPQSATGSGPHTVSYSTPGIKTAILEVSTEMGCFSTTSKNSINVLCCDNMFGLTAEITDILCGTEETGSIVLIPDIVSDVFTFEWSTGETTTGQSSRIDSLSAGEYSVTVSFPGFCDQFASFIVEDSDTLAIIDTIISEISVCYENDGGIELQVLGTAPIVFDWNDGNGFVNSNSLENLSVGTYVVDIMDALGCTNHLEIQIEAPENSDTDYAIPNVFTPNNDTYNDSFRIFASEGSFEHINLINFQVFNRWGELVFETDELDQPWDGNYKGKPAASDVYIYRVEMILPCDEETFVKTGEITLLR